MIPHERPYSSLAGLALRCFVALSSGQRRRNCPSDRSWLTLGGLEKPKRFLSLTDIALNGDSLTTGGRDVTNHPFRSVAASLLATKLTTTGKPCAELLEFYFSPDLRPARLSEMRAPIRPQRDRARDLAFARNAAFFDRCPHSRPCSPKHTKNFSL
jgi:hypothetical protein